MTMTDSTLQRIAAVLELMVANKQPDNCAQCVFFLLLDNDAPNGVCRRHCPKINDGLGLFPITHETYWCGEGRKIQS